MFLSQSAPASCILNRNGVMHFSYCKSKVRLTNLMLNQYDVTSNNFQSSSKVHLYTSCTFPIINSYFPYTHMVSRLKASPDKLHYCFLVCWLMSTRKKFCNVSLKFWFSITQLIKRLSAVMQLYTNLYSRTELNLFRAHHLHLVYWRRALGCSDDWCWWAWCHWQAELLNGSCVTSQSIAAYCARLTTAAHDTVSCMEYLPWWFTMTDWLS